MAQGEEPVRVEPLDLVSATRRLADADLSDRYGAFLPSLAAQAVRAGGRASVAVGDDPPSVVGVLLTDPADATASVFTRSLAIATQLRAEAPTLAVYAEHPLDGPSERFVVGEADPGATPAHRFRHRVRLASPADLQGVGRLLGQAYGPAAQRWAEGASVDGERCVIADVGGAIAGAGWLLVCGERARLHTLYVRPELRRLGVATDLVAARLMLAARAGAHLAISEVAEQNTGSLLASQRAGLRPAGEIRLYAPLRPEATGPTSA